MEVLEILEKKIESLLSLIKDLKAENTKLAEEKAILVEKLETMEGSMLKGHEDVEKLSQEKALTKMVVDDLISNIDSLVESKSDE